MNIMSLSSLGLEKGKAGILSPGEFHEMYSPWGLKESDTTE